MLHVQRAVILAAGMGSRLRPYTESIPKPLVEVNGISILHNALHQLSDLGVRHATIVVGYRKEAIESSCGVRFENVNIEYVDNPVFDQTGSAYSLWLARDTLLGGDTIFLEGDVFFEREVLERTLRNTSPRQPNMAAVAAFNTLMSGTAVELADDGSIRTFVMNQLPAEAQAKGLFKTINLTLFSGASLRQHLVPALNRVAVNGQPSVYVEQVLAGLVKDGGLTLAATDCSDTRWFEIDSKDDLQHAQKIFAQFSDHHSPVSTSSGNGAFT